MRLACAAPSTRAAQHVWERDADTTPGVKFEIGYVDAAASVQLTETGVVWPISVADDVMPPSRGRF